MELAQKLGVYAVYNSPSKDLLVVTPLNIYKFFGSIRWLQWLAETWRRTSKETKTDANAMELSFPGAKVMWNFRSQSEYTHTTHEMECFKSIHGTREQTSYNGTPNTTDLHNCWTSLQQCFFSKNL